MEKGRQDEKIEIAQKLIAQHFDNDTICAITGLSLEIVSKLK